MADEHQVETKEDQERRLSAGLDLSKRLMGHYPEVLAGDLEAECQALATLCEVTGGLMALILLDEIENIDHLMQLFVERTKKVARHVSDRATEMKRKELN